MLAHTRYQNLTLVDIIKTTGKKNFTQASRKFKNPNQTRRHVREDSSTVWQTNANIMIRKMANVCYIVTLVLWLRHYLSTLLVRACRYFFNSLQLARPRPTGSHWSLDSNVSSSDLKGGEGSVSHSENQGYNVTVLRESHFKSSSLRGSTGGCWRAQSKSGAVCPDNDVIASQSSQILLEHKVDSPQLQQIYVLSCTVATSTAVDPPALMAPTDGG